MGRWTCREAEPVLAEYVEATGGPGLQPVRRTHPALEEHLASCTACRAQLEDMRVALAWTRAAEEVAIPSGLVSRILEGTSGQAEAALPEWWRQLRAWLRPVLEPRFAMGAAMALISFSLLLNATGADVSRMELADLNPERLYFQLDRQAHLAGSRAVKFYRDLRIVYEIQSQLQVLREGSAPPEENKKAPPQSEPRRTPLNRKWSTETSLLAAAMLGGEHDLSSAR